VLSGGRRGGGPIKDLCECILAVRRVDVDHNLRDRPRFDLSVLVTSVGFVGEALATGLSVDSAFRVPRYATVV